jgi:predicted kinase
MTKKLTMLIGLPFSGKSVLASEYKNNGYEIISRDELLKEIINSDEFEINLLNQLISDQTDMNDPAAIFATQNKLAIDMLSARVKKIVSESEADDFIYDGTNLQKESRRAIINLQSDGIEVDGLYLSVPLAELKRRAVLAQAERRGQFNDISSLDRFIELLEEPTSAEGFSHLETRLFEPENARELKFK